MADELADIPAEELEELRAALAAMLSEGVTLNVRALRERAGAKTERAAAVLRAYRAGAFPVSRPRPPAPPAAAPGVTERLEEQAHGGALRRREAPAGAPPPLDLADLVAGIDSHEKALAAMQRINGALARGELGEKLHLALVKGVAEARQSIKGRALEGQEEVEDLRPCTREGADLLDVFEAIEDDARRASVVAFATREREADALTRKPMDLMPAPAEAGGNGETS